MTAGSNRRDVKRRMMAAATLAPGVLAGIAGCTRGTANRDAAKPEVGQRKAPAPTAAPVAALETAAAPQTVTGPVVTHQYGPVQVTVTISGGRITQSTGTGPNDNAVSAAINSDALPKLDAAAVTSQSAAITAVTGATLTSNAYKQSLQAALDQAMFHPGGPTGTPTPTTGPAAPTSAPRSTTSMPMGPMPTTTVPPTGVPRSTTTMPMVTVPVEVPTTAMPDPTGSEVPSATAPEPVVASPSYTG